MGDYRRQNDYDPTTVPYGKARVWVGVRKDAYPSSPVNRRMTNSFTAASVVGECEDGLVFECGGTWLLPTDEECFVEVFWHFEKEDTPWKGATEGHSRWIPLRVAEKYDAARIERRTGVNPLKTEPLPDKNDLKPTKTKKTPSPALTRATGASETSPEPAPKRKRGRPKGSKDTKPRKGRTKAENAPSKLPMGTMGTRITNDVAWRPNGRGGYDPLPVWMYEGRELVVIGGWFVSIPSGCVRSDDGRTPDVVLRSLVA